MSAITKIQEAFNPVVNNKFGALLVREFNDHKNGFFYAPLILGGLALLVVVLGTLGFGNTIHFDGMEVEGITSLADALNKLKVSEEASHMPAAIALLYHALGSTVWVAFPFVLISSLLACLYEERRDRSILFWKSMPVADWQEILAKYVGCVFVSYFCFVGIAIALELVLALFLMIVMIFQGGPVMDMLPLGYMLETWVFSIPMYIVFILWLTPVFMWLLFASSVAPRMPFMFAIIPPIVLVILEELLFDTENFLRTLAIQLGGWMELNNIGVEDRNIDGPQDVFDLITDMPVGEMISTTFMDTQFWGGLIVAAAFFFGALYARKRAM